MAFYETLILIISSVLLFVYWKLKKAHSYFENQGIPYVKPNFFFGNVTDVILLRKCLPQVYLDVYKRLAPHKFGGMYVITKPTIMIRDPELIKHVLIKDFAYFHDRGISINAEVDPVTNHLFTMRGEKWKNLRIKLTSTFTTSKMKMMFPLVQKCGEKLSELIGQISPEEPFNIKELAARYTTDAIGTCAFGLETGTLENPNSEFRQMGQKIFKYRFRTLLRALWPTIPPKWIKRLNLTFIDKKVQDFFINIVDETVTYREDNQVTRYDFLDLLIALKNNTTVDRYHDSGEVEDLQKFLSQVGDKRIKSEIEMTNELLAAQCFIFFAAGFEASSSTLGYCMLELSQNQEIQNKLRNEIRSVLESTNGQLSYEAMKQMTYMDMVIAETLRKFPAAGFLFRECSKDYEIPDTKFIVPAKMSVSIPIYGIHLDEQYYDNPEEFRPERFTEEEKAKRPNYTYLPFGDGPRVCIGERFAKLQVKIGLIFILKDFSYRLSSKTKFPIEFEKNFGLLTPKNGIWLHTEKI